MYCQKLKYFISTVLVLHRMHVLDHPMAAFSRSLIASTGWLLSFLQPSLAWMTQPETCACLESIVLVNGIYDLICAACIILLEPPIRVVHAPLNAPLSPHVTLSLPSPVLRCVQAVASLHSGMWMDASDREYPLVRRLLAYWILTYGAVRVAYGSGDPWSASTGPAALTFFAEAAALIIETWRFGSVHPTKASCVYAVCAVLGAWVLRCG
jgi:hypothetical protein